MTYEEVLAAMRGGERVEATIRKLDVVWVHETRQFRTMEPGNQNGNF